MRKIKKEFENPFDNILIDICELVSPFFHKLNFTPNGITTLSLITGLLSCYFLHKNKPYLSVSFLLLSYFFDCLDGFYARKYNMITKFGDCYDHVKDLVVNISLPYILYNRNKHKLNRKELIIFIFIFSIYMYTMNIHFSLQEMIYDKPEQSGMLALGTRRYADTKEQAEKMIAYTRYSGSGTFTLLNMLAVLYLEFK